MSPKKTLSGAEVLERLRGRWTLERAITDRRQGQAGRFAGEAWFEPEGEGLRYREAGTLQLAGASFFAERRYLWRAEGSFVVVDYDDGRDFHRFEVVDGMGAAQHSCAPDHYDVSYDFSVWPDWTARWRVSGPMKDYEMYGVYRR